MGEGAGNYLRPQFMFNAYYINRGSWVAHIPGVRILERHLAAGLAGDLGRHPLPGAADPGPGVLGAVFASMAALRYFRDDQGLGFVDRGVRRLPVRARTAVGTLAVIGFANVAMSLHTIPSVWASLYLHDTVPIPSYLRAGMCGEGTPHPCPGPGVPILLPGPPR